jgi:hypothetical protein
MPARNVAAKRKRKRILIFQTASKNKHFLMIKDKNRTAAVVEDDLNNTTIWTTKRVEELLEKMDDGAKVKDTPFWDNDFHWRAADILYQYTPEEIEEIKRCKTDIIYFANKYCHTMTDDGVVQIQLRDYQRDVLRDLYENRFCVWLSPRQIGKTILTGIFLTHYLLFNTDRNTMVLSNNGGTTQEIIDKIKTIMIHLPFFLKPGIRKNDVMTMKFDNGCRLMGKTTTKTRVTPRRRKHETFPITRNAGVAGAPRRAGRRQDHLPAAD